MAATQQSDPQRAAPPTSVLPLTSWKRDGDDWVSEPTSKLPGLRAIVRVHSRSDGQSEISVETKASAPVWLRLLSLELESDSIGAEIGGRDLRPKKVTTRAALSGLDPKWVILRPSHKPWTMLVDDDVDGVKVQELQTQVLLQTDLLTSEYRPIVYLQQCTHH